MSALRLPFRESIAVIAALITVGFVDDASLQAQPAQKPPAAAAKNPRPEKKAETPQKPVEKKAGDKKLDDKNVEPKKPDDKKPEVKSVEERKSDREALAKEFAEKHHPELASLLKTLETMSPQAYAAAVRDVSRAAERLNAMQERDEERYERELDVWKTRSRVHVVSAEYRVAPGPDLEKKLRDLLHDELQAKRKLLTFERDRAGKRIEQLDRELRELDEKGSALIDRQIERLPKVPASTPKAKPKS